MTSAFLMHLDSSAPQPPMAPKYTAPCSFMAETTSSLRLPLPIMPVWPMEISVGEYASMR